jgi:hypothetical protein
MRSPPVPTLRSSPVSALGSPPAVADPRPLQAPTPDTVAPPLLHLHRGRLTSAPVLLPLCPDSAPPLPRRCCAGCCAATAEVLFSQREERKEEVTARGSLRPVAPHAAGLSSYARFGRFCRARKEKGFCIPWARLPNGPTTQTRDVASQERSRAPGPPWQTRPKRPPNP